jgi:hypothetical protein
MDETTYDVRVYKTDVYKGKEVTTYWVRWKVAGAPKPFKEPFRHASQADSFRSKLNSAAKDGKAFSVTTGRPVEWERDKPKEPGPPPVTWYTLTLDYAKAKWKFSSPNQRRSIAESLTDATEVLFTAESPYPRAEVRRALATWAYSARLRGEAEPPEDVAPVIKWLETATITVAALGDPETSGIHARAILDRINSKQDNTRCAANPATANNLLNNTTNNTTNNGRSAIPTTNSASGTPAANNAASNSTARPGISTQGLHVFKWGDYQATAYGCARSGTRVLCDFDLTKDHAVQANQNVWNGLILLDQGGKIIRRHDAFFLFADGSQANSAYLSSETPVRMIMEFDGVNANSTSVSLSVGQDRVDSVPVTAEQNNAPAQKQ